ncbi:serine protease 27-like [Thamnophis elegans]|uniref:serine protease 27-like n=1 Tax=Thamnophis elegans TaxID=35005 RepID=UPI001377E772|nr:serine protease 27-like [Thamnophis elegans]
MKMEVSINHKLFSITQQVFVSAFVIQPRQGNSEYHIFFVYEENKGRKQRNQQWCYGPPPARAREKIVTTGAPANDNKNFEIGRKKLCLGGADFGSCKDRLRAQMRYYWVMLSVGLGLPDVEPSYATRVCGKQGYLNRIVGGTDSRDGEWPWQVSIKLNGHHHCGGSLVTNQWIITASHCFSLIKNPSNFTVLVGALKLSDPGPQSIIASVKHIILNPSYEGDSRIGDIALVQLEQRLPLSQQISPICVPNANVNFLPGQKCWVTGWGNILSKEGRQNSDILQKLEVPIISTKKCNSLYRQDSRQRRSSREIKEDMICAGFAAGQRDACQGDSGGPLACRMEDFWFIAGVVSWGDGCAQKNRPGVYAKVAYYQKWIHSQIPELRDTHGSRVNNSSISHSASTGSFSFISLLAATIVLQLLSQQTF